MGMLDHYAQGLKPITGLLDIEYSLLLRLNCRKGVGRSPHSWTHPGSHASKTCHYLWSVCTSLGPLVSSHYRLSMQPADTMEFGTQQMHTSSKSSSTLLSYDGL